MKKINIFLASSIVEFATERMTIENFIRNVSDKFEERYNIKLQPLLCENFDDAFTKGRKQDEYNDMIRNSDLCFFIFFTKVGEYTREEFEVARAQFESVGKPKIYTYFKVVEEGKAEQSVRDFMNELDKSLGHYYGTFEHIDTVKLRILLSLKLSEMDFVEIKVEDGKCVVDGKDAMPLKNVSEFANNKTLKELYTRLETTEKEYLELKPVYASGECDENTRSRYIKVAAARQSLMDEIDTLEKLIFNMSLRMSKDDLRGDITERQKKAYGFFKQGDYESCLAVLDSKDIDDEFEREEKKDAYRRKQRRSRYIREYKTKIEILFAMTEYGERFKEITECYEKIYSYALEEKVELETVCDYAAFLYNQNRHKKAVEILEKLISKDSLATKLKGKIFNLFAMVLGDLNDFVKAEEYHLRATEIREVLAKENPEMYNGDLSISYNNAGSFYDDQGKTDKAEEYYLRAIEIREALAKENPERYNGDLATSYNNIGYFYNHQGKADKAEEYYLRAIEINEVLAKETPERYNGDLALSYNNAGSFYDDQGKMDKAEEYYLRAIEINEVLAKENPERYNGDLATSYNNAGSFYDDQGKADKAEENYLRAIEINEVLAKENPEKYNGYLALSYNNAGSFYDAQGKTDKAEEYYLRAIEINEVLAKENPEKYNGDLALSYNNAGAFYTIQGKADKAEDYYLRAIKIREVLAKENPERYNGDLASSYNNIGYFYDAQGKADKAEEYYLRAIEIREALAKENPERYNGDLATSYNNIGYFYDAQGKADKAEEYYIRAIKISEALAKENRERYNGDLALSYYNAGSFYDDQGKADKAEEYYLRAIEINEVLAKENRERYNGDLALSYYNFGIFKGNVEYLKKAYRLAKTRQDIPECRKISEWLSDYDF